MRTNVFLCYSHKDRKFRDELLTQLQACSDQVTVWSDRAIPAGVEWLPEIDRALGTVDAAVIVVSPDLLASGFVTAHEMPGILERHRRDGLRPMWVHYRPALYKKSPLAALQCLHDPDQPLSLLKKAKREQVLVEIATQICDAPPLRPIGNVMRAADEVFAAEHRFIPSLTTSVRPDRIDMKVRGQRRALPFVTAKDLERRLSPEERRVLRAHERSMDVLLRRWERLRPKALRGGADDVRSRQELQEVRTLLAREFDAALGLIERLGYSLDDHYQAVRHVVGEAVPTARGRPRAPSVQVRFVLDGKGQPQWSRKENGYWLQTWVEDAPDRAASVVWRMHPTMRPTRETVDAGPEFRKDFVAYDDFALRADLRTRNRVAIRTVDARLSDALREQYAGTSSPSVRRAIDDIASN